jgi:hypothetical protein
MIHLESEEAQYVYDIDQRKLYQKVKQMDV